MEIQQVLIFGYPKKLEDTLARVVAFGTTKERSTSHLQVRSDCKYPSSKDRVPLIEITERGYCWNCGLQEYFKRDCSKIQQNQIMKILKVYGAKTGLCPLPITKILISALLDNDHSS